MLIQVMFLELCEKRKFLLTTAEFEVMYLVHIYEFLKVGSCKN